MPCQPHFAKLLKVDLPRLQPEESFLSRFSENHADINAENSINFLINKKSCAGPFSMHRIFLFCINFTLFHIHILKENIEAFMKYLFHRLARSRNLLILAAAYIIGAGTGNLYSFLRSEQNIVETSASSTSWGLSFQEEGKRPVGNASVEELAQYDAYFAEDTEEKVLYLTFDCGYENGNMPVILDALKKHHVPATFFVVGNFIKDNPALIKRMVQEGHIVGNHTFTHPDMSSISSMEAFEKELSSVEKLYESLIQAPMTKFYRPPRGIYSTENLSMAKELGYKTFFWSLAYVDWYEDKQPTKEEAFAKLLTRIHPGAVVLLHSTSKTNGEILDELLTKWEEMGYTFHSLTELIKN